MSTFVESVHIHRLEADSSTEADVLEKIVEKTCTVEEPSVSSNAPSPQQAQSQPKQAQASAKPAPASAKQGPGLPASASQRQIQPVIVKLQPVIVKLHTVIVKLQPVNANHETRVTLKTRLYQTHNKTFKYTTRVTFKIHLIP